MSDYTRYEYHNLKTQLVAHESLPKYKQKEWKITILTKLIDKCENTR